MKKQIVINIIICIILTTFLFALSGCSGSNLSGIYVNEQDDTEYMEFSGKDTATLHSDGAVVHGTYRIQGNVLLVSFDTGYYNSDMPLVIDKGKTTVYFGDIALIKEKGFWAKHWLKFVVGFVILGLIITIYEKITGRNFDDDMDAASERMEEAVDKLFDDIHK